jgi:phage shock protein A
MALLERVATLLRANLNDMIDRAEDPLKMMNQVVLDMENQLLQVKTQVAIAIADHHLLEKKRAENVSKEADWVRKAEMAVSREDEELARAALARSLASREMAKSFEEQLADQRAQVENLKSALHKLESKLAEARTQADLLKAQHRRARAANKAADVQLYPPSDLERVRDKVEREASIGVAKNEMLTSEAVEERFAKLEKQEEIDRLLAELKSKRSA